MIHQPRYEIFELFHDLLLLAKGGRTVYMGETCHALPYFEHILGTTIPPHVNPSDWFLDAITLNGAELADRYEKLHPNFTSIHRDHLEAVTDSNSASYIPSEEAFPSPFHPINSPDRLDSDFPSSPHPADPELLLQIQALNNRDYSPRPYGSLWHDFLPMFFLTLFMPFLTPYAMRSQGGVLCRRLGGLIGSLTGLSCVFLLLSILSFHYIKGSYSLMAGTLFIVGFIGGSGMVIFSILRLRARKDIRHCGHFIGGVFLGPLGLGFSWRKLNTSPKIRLASLRGFIVNILLGFILICGLLQANWVYAFIWPAVLLPIWIIFWRRISYDLPSFDRPSSGFWLQLWLVFARSVILESRSLIIWCFDLILAIVSALALGIVFFGQYYQQPLISRITPEKNCPALFGQEVCFFLSFPLFNPILFQASLSCLSLALAAVSSSLRTFGNQALVFKREATGDLSTEAFYLGRTLAHLPTCLLASLFFTLTYYAFLLPPANIFGKLFAVFFLVYFATSGLAYCLSLLLPSGVQQLAGVLSVLSLMLFSGANPTLAQLKQNVLIPEALYYISFISFFRYSQELYYLIAVEHYNPTQSSLDILGYAFYDEGMSWVGLVLIGIIFRSIAYIVLVFKERKLR